MDAVVVAPNSAIDSYYELDRFTVGEVHVARRVLHTAGGKGLNLARALKNIGGAPFCLGLIGGESGRFIQMDLEAEGIASDLTWTDEESRRCVTLSFPGAPDTTVILERGGEVDLDLVQALYETCLRHVHRAPFFVLTGSLPAGFPPDFYAGLVRLLKRFRVQVCLDASGESLWLAAEAGPALIKVNRLEFEQAFLADGQPFTCASGRAVYDRLHQHGLETLVVTDGAAGAYVYQRGALYHVQTRVESWVSTAGAGDTFLAALIYRFNRAGAGPETYIFASAAAAANMQELGCGRLDPAQIEVFAAQTALAEVSP